MQPIHFLTRRKLLEIPSSAFYYKKKTKTKQIKSKTQLLISSSSSTFICPAFASGENCKCNPGFIYSIPSNGCILEQRCSPKYRLSFSLHTENSLRLIKKPLSSCQPHQIRDTYHGHCKKQKTAILNASLIHSSSTTTLRICGPGQFYDFTTKSCISCPIGFYSSYYSLSPCIPCPHGMTTSAERSLSKIQCVIPLEADHLFFSIS